MLTIKYLQERHQYWAQKLFDLGIFKNMLKLIPFEIKYNVKSLNGVFRAHKRNERIEIEKIIIYPKDVSDIISWIDDILVHEMIHQYIFDNKIKDTSSHGVQFKILMNKINNANIGVKITVTKEGKLPESNIYQSYKILYLKFPECFFLCKVKSTKVDHFTNLIVSGKISWKLPLIGFGWYKTKNAYFSSWRDCVSRLHGNRYLIQNQKEIFEKFELQKMNVIQEL